MQRLFLALTLGFLFAVTFLSCGGGGGGGGGVSTTSPGINPADIVLAQINSPANPVLAIATVRDGSETVSVLGTRDSTGKPTAVTDIVYISTKTLSAASASTGKSRAVVSAAPSKVGRMNLDPTGLPITITDDLGNTATFQNYNLTKNTVDISVTTANGTTRPPFLEVFDPALSDAGKNLVTNPNPFELLGNAFTVYGAWSCIAAADALGTIPLLDLACAGTILQQVARMPSKDIQTLAETSGKSIEIAECISSRGVDCISLALPVLQEVFKAPEKDFSGYYLGGTHQFYVNQSDQTVNGMFDNSIYSGKVYGNIMVLKLNQFPQSCPGTVGLTGIFNSNINTSNVPTLNYNMMGTDCSGKAIAGSGSTTTFSKTSLCTFAYSGWSACQPDGTQTRTVTGSPPGCAGTPDNLVQSCTYVVPPPPPNDVTEVYIGTQTITESTTYQNFQGCSPDPYTIATTHTPTTVEIDVYGSLLTSGSVVGKFVFGSSTVSLPKLTSTCSGAGGSWTWSTQENTYTNPEYNINDVNITRNGTTVTFNPPMPNTSYASNHCDVSMPTGNITVDPGTAIVHLSSTRNYSCTYPNGGIISGTIEYSLTRQ